MNERQKRRLKSLEKAHKERKGREKEELEKERARHKERAKNPTFLLVRISGNGEEAGADIVCRGTQEEFRRMFPISTDPSQAGIQLWFEIRQRFGRNATYFFFREMAHCADGSWEASDNVDPRLVDLEE